jgi:hypothetical protein
MLILNDLPPRVVASLHRNMSRNPIAKGLRKVTPPISDQELSALADSILQRIVAYSIITYNAGPDIMPAKSSTRIPNPLFASSMNGIL